MISIFPLCYYVLLKDRHHTIKAAARGTSTILSFMLFLFISYSFPQIKLVHVIAFILYPLSTLRFYLMEKFDKVIQDAERHLEAAEKSSIDLARRIQEVSKACAVAEVDVEKSTAAIASSEKRLSILAHQQSDTRKRLSALYRSLIAIPSVTAKVGDNSMSALGVVDVSVVSSSSTAQDLAILQCCFFNSLISTSNIDTLVRHTHFIHAELRLDRGIDIKIGPHLPPGDNSLLSDGSARNNEKFSIDPMTPLCMFALTGGCKNKVRHICSEGPLFSQLFCRLVAFNTWTKTTVTRRRDRRLRLFPQRTGAGGA